MRSTGYSLPAEMSTGACCATLDGLSCIEYLKNTHQSYPMPIFRANVGKRRKREFTPDAQKDSNYWIKRNRNNEAAKRSRQRKRLEEYLMETRAFELQRENEQLKVALSVVNHHNTGLNNHMNAGFQGMPNHGCTRNIHVPTTLTPMNVHCRFHDRCGSVCTQKSHFNSVNDLISYSGTENTVNTKLPHISLLDRYSPMSRYSHGMNACSSGVFLNNSDFSHENYTSPVWPYYSSPAVSLPHNSRCYSARTSSSETTGKWMRQSGLNGASHKVPVETKASGGTCQQKPESTQSVLLPHKLRHKVNNARFVTKYLS